MELADVAVTEVVIEDKSAAGAASAVANLEKVAAAGEETGQRTKRGLELFDAALEKTRGSTLEAANATVTWSRAQASAAGEVARLVAQYDPAAAQVQRLARAEATLDRAIAQGVTTQEEKARVLDLVRQKMAATNAANDNLARAATGATTAGRNMGAAFQQAGFQVGDFAVQVASGQGVLRPLIQQGTQLVSMFGPWGAVIGAAGAVVGALVMSLWDFDDAAEKAEKAAKNYDKVMSDVESNLKRATAAGKDLRSGLQEEGGTVADLIRYYASLSATMREVEQIRLQSSRNKVVESMDEQRAAVAGFLGELDTLNNAAQRMAEFRKLLNERRQGLGAAPLEGLPKEVTDVTDAIERFKASDSPEAIGELAVALKRVADGGGPFAEQAKKAAAALADPATKSVALADKLKLLDANMALIGGTATTAQKGLLSMGDAAAGAAKSQANFVEELRREAAMLGASNLQRQVAENLVKAGLATTDQAIKMAKGEVEVTDARALSLIELTRQLHANKAAQEAANQSIKNATDLAEEQRKAREAAGDRAKKLLDERDAHIAGIEKEIHAQGLLTEAAAKGAHEYAVASEAMRIMNDNVLIGAGQAQELAERLVTAKERLGSVTAASDVPEALAEEFEAAITEALA